MKYKKIRYRCYELTATYSRGLLACMCKADATYKQNGTVPVVVGKGRITIHPGFRWNGADIVDFKCAREASLVHDALCNLIREGKIPSTFRKCADQQYYCMTKVSCGRLLANTMYDAIRGNKKMGLIGAFIRIVLGLTRLIGPEDFECT